MTIYDQIIRECEELLEPFSGKRLLPEHDMAWPNEESQKLIMRDETVCELGGGMMLAPSGIAFTSGDGGDGRQMSASREYEEDEIWLYGPDLPELSGYVPYARLTVLDVDDSGWEDNAKAYEAMRRIDYTRYHIYPKGYMMRVSMAESREPVRVSAQAVAEGLNFAVVGGMFVDAYRRHPEVRGVKLIFITEPDFPYELMAQKVEKMGKITRSLDKIFDNLVMDCRSCTLKPICDEVEGMRQLHINQYTSHTQD